MLLFAQGEKNYIFKTSKIEYNGNASIGRKTQIICRPNVIMKFEKHSFTFYNRGISYSKIGSYNNAINDFSQAIKLQHDKPEFYFNRACLYKKIGLNLNAIEDFSIVINFYPRYYNPYFNKIEYDFDLIQTIDDVINPKITKIYYSIKLSDSFRIFDSIK